MEFKVEYHLKDGTVLLEKFERGTKQDVVELIELSLNLKRKFIVVDAWNGSSSRVIVVNRDEIKLVEIFER